MRLIKLLDGTKDIYGVDIIVYGKRIGMYVAMEWRELPVCLSIEEAEVVIDKLREAIKICRKNFSEKLSI